MQVSIAVTRSTQYHSIVEMTKAEFTRLNKALQSDDRSIQDRAEEEVNSLINVNDWQDDRFEDIDIFQPYVKKP